MSKTAVKTDNAPSAIGPYSQGVIANGFLFTSGQLPLDPATGKIPQGPVAHRARLCLMNLQSIALAAGTGMDRAVKITVFLTDISQFKAVNEVYESFFPEPFPARSAVQVAALPLGADIEIEGVFQI